MFRSRLCLCTYSIGFFFHAARGNVSEQEQKERNPKGTSQPVADEIETSPDKRDPLTGLLRGREFFDRLEALISRTPPPTSDAPVSIILLEVGNMRELNRAKGYRTGDLVLRRTGHRIRTWARDQLRSEGDASEEGVRRVFTGRPGGARFSLCVPVSGQKAGEIADDMLKELRENVKSELGDNVTVSFHVGVATFPGDGENVDELLKAAMDVVRRSSAGEERPNHRLDPGERMARKKKKELVSDLGPEVDLESRDRLVLFSALRRIIQSRIDTDEILSVTLRTVVEVTAARSGFVLLKENGDLKPVARYSFSPGDESVEGSDSESMDRNNGDRKTEDDQSPEEVPFQEAVSQKLVERAFSEDSGLLIENASEDETFHRYSTVEKLDLRSVLVVPFSAGDAKGGIYLENSAVVKRFDREDLKLVEAIAEELSVYLKKAREHQKQKEELESVRDRLRTAYDYDNIVGESDAMKEVFQTLDRVIPTDLNVVIEGETGTGKELAARAIHYNGPRKEEPFLAVNCARFSENLLESELFGHVEGAFTGANRDRRGLFEQADGGSLFLDEISGMSPPMQAKLLRVLETGKVRRVGGEDEKTVDVRILCATNESLKKLMKEGQFREDLYYRLKDAKVRMPPLRERREDIPLLVDHFLNEVAEEQNQSPKEVEEDVMQEMIRRSWPGNVRQLRSTVRQMALFAGDRERIVRDDLLATDEPGRDRSGETEETMEPEVEQMSNWNQLSAAEKRELIQDALERTDGNKTEAAEEIGISRRTLYRFLSE